MSPKALLAPAARRGLLAGETAATLLLGIFALRRCLFIVAASLPGRNAPASNSAQPAGRTSVALIVVAHDEERVLDRLVNSIERLSLAPDAVVLVCDGSTDGTLAVMRARAARHPTWSVIAMNERVGKGAALNAGLAACAATELVAFSDADIELEPGCLAALSAALTADRRAAAASGLLWPQDHDRSPVARYCALELWQHQLITSAAKERLALNPPAHGWLACYRRSALEQVGGFPTASLGEDVEATNALLSAGWRTRFVGAARVRGQVPWTLSAYWRQHVRWTRALHEGAPLPGRRSSPAGHSLPGPRAGSVIRRTEIYLHAAGYLDRPLLALVAGLALVRHRRPWAAAAYAGLLGGEATVALALAGRLRSAPRFLIAVAQMVAVDLAVAVTGSILQLTRRPRRW